MANLSRSITAAGFRSIHALKLTKLLPRNHGGLGVVFMAHRVSPDGAPGSRFAPNSYLSITPDYLAQTIDYVRAQDMDIISIDDVSRRIVNPTGRRFAVFTLDDGYRDNLEHAYRVFKRLKAPFTIYIPSSWPDGGGRLWWLALEAIIAANDFIEPEIASLPAKFMCRTVSQKNRAFRTLDKYFDGIKDCERMAHVDALAGKYKVDMEELSRIMIMNWDDIRKLADDDLATIGAHSVTHRVLSDLNPDELCNELEQSRTDIERKLGRPCRHLAYPYGDVRCVGEREFLGARNAGYQTAVTTSSRPVQTGDGENLLALPRISLDGDRQNLATLDVQISGLPQAVRSIWND